jgi:hypothetical protein
VTRTPVLTAALTGALLVGVGAPLAATIIGTKGDDTLRGTPRADRLEGRGGDDRLYGRGGRDVLVGGRGDDVLVGGPGADRLACGPGRDVAWADARDRVARDCETVKGLGPPPPPTRPGTYCGATSQGMSICLDVGTTSGIQVVARVRISVQTSCEPARHLAYDYTLTTRAAVRGDRTFGSHVAFPGLDITMAGAFGSARTSVTGSLRIQVVDLREGVEYRCDSGDVSWSATTPPPTPSAELGRFCGTTEQGFDLCFDVSGSPKTVANLTFLVRTECTPPATLGVSSTIPTAYAIREDGVFAFERTGTGTTGGGTFTVTHTMQGVFDAAGTAATGTLAAQLTYVAPDGVRHECEAGTFAWTVARQ